MRSRNPKTGIAKPKGEHKDADQGTLDAPTFKPSRLNNQACVTQSGPQRPKGRPERACQVGQAGSHEATACWKVYIHSPPEGAGTFMHSREAEAPKSLRRPRAAPKVWTCPPTGVPLMPVQPVARRRKGEIGPFNGGSMKKDTQPGSDAVPQA